MAIRTTQGALEQALRATLPRYPSEDAPLPLYRMGPVRYIDHDKTELDTGDPFGRWFLKRRAFQHEGEYRVVAPLPELLLKPGVKDTDTPTIVGVPVRVDLNALIHEAVLPPHAPDWFQENVLAVVTRFALSAPVRASSMDSVPEF